MPFSLLPRDISFAILEWLALQMYMELLRTSKYSCHLIKEYLQFGARLDTSDYNKIQNCDVPIIQNLLALSSSSPQNNHLRVLRCHSHINNEDAMAAVIQANSASLRVVSTFGQAYSQLDACVSLNDLQMWADTKNGTTALFANLSRIVRHNPALRRLWVGWQNVHSLIMKPAGVSELVDAMCEHRSIRELCFEIPSNCVPALGQLTHLVSLKLLLLCSTNLAHVAPLTLLTALTHLTIHLDDGIDGINPPPVWHFPLLQELDCGPVGLLVHTIEAPRLRKLVITVCSEQWVELWSRYPQLTSASVHVYSRRRLYGVDEHHGSVSSSSSSSSCQNPFVALGSSSGGRSGVDSNKCFVVVAPLIELHCAAILPTHWPFVAQMTTLQHLHLSAYSSVPANVIRRCLHSLSASLTSFLINNNGYVTPRMCTRSSNGNKVMATPNDESCGVSSLDTPLLFPLHLPHLSKLFVFEDASFYLYATDAFPKLQDVHIGMLPSAMGSTLRTLVQHASHVILERHVAKVWLECSKGTNPSFLSETARISINPPDASSAPWPRFGADGDFVYVEPFPKYLGES